MTRAKRIVAALLAAVLAASALIPIVWKAS